jgi:conjugal transfer pilus assembly protein TraW
MLSDAMRFFTCPLLMVLIVYSIGIAKDLGTMGATYQIIERDALEEIEERAKQVDWGKLFDKEKNEQRIKNYRPKDLVALKKAEQDRTRIVDVTYTLDFDIPDEKGNVLYPKGFTFNPLDYIVYPRTIIVLDGMDSVQVDWFKKSPYFKNVNAVLWITDGNYYDLSAELGRAVYYANSMIVARFNILAVPSVIVQKGNALEVTEIDVKAHSKKKPS